MAMLVVTDTDGLSRSISPVILPISLSTSTSRPLSVASVNALCASALSGYRPTIRIERRIER